MKAMFAAFAAMILIAIAAPAVLGTLGFSSAETNAGAAVRISEPEK